MIREVYGAASCNRVMFFIGGNPIYCIILMQGFATFGQADMDTISTAVVLLARLGIFRLSPDSRWRLLPLYQHSCLVPACAVACLRVVLLRLYLLGSISLRSPCPML